MGLSHSLFLLLYLVGTSWLLCVCVRECDRCVQEEGHEAAVAAWRGRIPAVTISLRMPQSPGLWEVLRASVKGQWLFPPRLNEI